MTYVLRLKGKTGRGYYFYDYIDEYYVGPDLPEKEFLAVERMKYATEFDSQKEALKLLNEFPDSKDDFEIIDYETAEKEYYNNWGKQKK